VQVLWSVPPEQLQEDQIVQGLTQRTIRQRSRAVEEPPHWV
jgi:hypothetical protein